MSVDPTKATLVSIVPLALHFEIPHINPSYYDIPASKKGKPEVLVVGEANYDVYLGEGKNLPQLEPAYRVAQGIIDKYTNAQLFTGEGSKPGLFWVMGSLTSEEVQKNHAAELATAYQLQRGWFTALIRDADDFWAKYHQHKGISDLQRIACKELGQERDWLFVVPDSAPVRCPACRTVLDASALVCAVCKTIVKPEEYKKLGLISVGA